MKNHINIIISLWIAVFLFSTSLHAQTSSVGALATLYTNGHPRNNLQGQIFGLTGFENYLYASWHYFTDPEIDRNEEIHIWNIAEPTNPQLIGVLAFPGVLEGFEQSLNSPRNLAVIKGHLVFWSANRLYVYLINQNGTLTEQLVTAFEDDLNPDGTGVFDVQGNYASTLRTMLSNNEFLQNPDEDRLQDYALVNLQNPTQPYLETLNRDVGKDLLFLNNGLTGTFKGLPASVKLSLDGANLELSTLSLRRSIHFQRFWKAPLQSLFGRKNLNVPLGVISNRAVSGANPGKLSTDLFKRFLKVLRLGANFGLSDAISAGYADDITLKDALADLKIDPSDSIQLVLEKIIEGVVRSRFDSELESLVGQTLLTSFSKELFGSKARSVRALQTDLKKSFDKVLTAQGLESYLVNFVLNPLVDDQAILRIRLSELISRIADSPIGGATDAALRAFHFFFPTAAIQAGLPFDTPRCFRIPRNSRDLLRQLLVDTGPRLNPRGFALFEMLKMVDFYTGSGNFRRLSGGLNTRLRSLHAALSSQAVSTILAELDIFATASSKVSRALGTLAQRIQLEKALSVPLAKALNERLVAAGLDPNQSLSSFLSAQRLHIDPLLIPAGESLATIANIKAKVTELGLTAVKIETLLRRAPVLGRAAISSVLQSISRDLLSQIFGSQGDLTSLEKALEQLVTSKLSSKLFGDFVSAAINQILSTVNDGTPLPNIFGTISLANRGDCIAQWQRALTAMELAATGSVLFSNVVIPIQGAFSNLTTAYQNVLSFVLQNMLEKFLSEIFSQAVRDYSSWFSRPDIQNVSIPLAQILDAATEVAIPLSYQGQIGLFATNASPFRNFGPNLPASLIVFNPDNIAGTKVTIALGEWLSVDNVSSLNETLLIQGSKLINDAPTPASLLVNLNGTTGAVQTIGGSLAESIAFADNLTLARGGQVLAATNLANQVVLMQTGKGK